MKECLGSSKDTGTVSVQKLCQPYREMMNRKERFDLNWELCTYVYIHTYRIRISCNCIKLIF